MENVILKGDCLIELKKLEDNSIDSIVTDPPYGLEFMGKEWDAPWKAGKVEWADEGTDKSHPFRDGSARIEYGIGGKASIGFQEWFTVVATEALRVLKPGGHLLAFGGTRTWHRLAVAIEDAGFEIRDSIHWTYGSGFPKSLDVSKAIDSVGGVHPDWNPEAYGAAVAASPFTHADVDRHLGIKASSCYWERTDDRACVPLFKHWEKARDFLGLGNDFAAIAGEVVREDRVVQEIGTSNSLSGAVVAVVSAGAPATPAAQEWQGWGTALKPSHEPIVVARKPLIGTVASNVLEHGTGALNIDGSRIGTGTGESVTYKVQDMRGGNYGQDKEAYSDRAKLERTKIDQGRWPANTILTHSTGCQPPDCVTGCPVAELGEPSRFFYQTEGWDPDLDVLVYRSKPSKKERNAGIDKNNHPTVKPVALMRYLIRLVTPPDGVVLDPFLGSGTTAVAATLEGFKWVGCEMTEDYYSIIEGRVAHAEKEYKKQNKQLELDCE